MPDPTPAAMRAARELWDRRVQMRDAPTEAAVIEKMARLIDEATGLPELIKAAKLADDELCGATWVKGTDRKGLKYASEQIRKALAKIEEK